jgi:hypothetical protein
MKPNPKCVGNCPVLASDLEAIRNSVESVNSIANEDYRRHCVQSNECSGTELIVRNGSVIQICPLFDVQIQMAERYEF